MTKSGICRIAAATILAASLLSSCCAEPAPEPTLLYVGFQTDQPGLGYTDGQRQSGFEYDMANWLADHLGVDFVRVSVKPDQREDFVERGAVDLMIGTYSKTDERLEEVSFAAPYMITQQGAMVLNGDKTLSQVENLADGRLVCAARGTTSIAQLRELGASPFEATGDGACVEAMLSGNPNVRAVSTDQLILHGWANRDPRLKVVEPVVFGHQERYGIGLKKGDIVLCEKIKAAIKDYLNSGVWELHFRNNLGPDIPIAKHKPDPNDLDSCLDSSDG